MVPKGKEQPGGSNVVKTLQEALRRAAAQEEKQVEKQVYEANV